MVKVGVQPQHADAAQAVKEFLKTVETPLTPVKTLERHIKNLYDSIHYAERVKAGNAFSDKGDQQVLAKIHRLKGFIALIQTSSNPLNIAQIIAMQYYKVSRIIEICKVRSDDIKTVTCLHDQKKRIGEMKRENGFEAASKAKEVFEMSLNFQITEFIDELNAKTVHRIFIKS